MRKKPLLPCSCCPGLSLQPGRVFGPQQSPTPQSQAARAESHCNSNNSLFTSWSKNGICKQRGRRGGGGQNTTDLVKETLKKYHTCRPLHKHFFYQSAVRRRECNKCVAHRELGVGGSPLIKKNGSEQRKRFC